MRSLTKIKFSTMVITDLDGTLLRTDRTCSAPNLEKLAELGRRGVLRIIATGRTLYSARQVLKPDFPVDYLIFSSGIGIWDWQNKKLLAEHHFEEEQSELTLLYLYGRKLDFTVHQPAPNTHRFVYFKNRKMNSDFERRIQKAGKFAERGRSMEIRFSPISFFVVIEPKQYGRQTFIALRKSLSYVNVVRTTSPLDNSSLWVEILPSSVSKAKAAEWLRKKHKIAQKAICAVGNDYNDEELLKWAGTSFVVANGPRSLRAKYPTVDSNDADGFAQAVGGWGAKENNRYF